MIRREVVDDVAYIAWEAQPWFPLAIDTFVVRDGKIFCFKRLRRMQRHGKRPLSNDYRT